MHPGLDTAEELAAHALSHRLGAHHHAHLDGAVSPASGTEPMAHADGATPCPHGGVHSHADTDQGSDADQADCDSALHCMGSHLVSLLPGCVVRSVAPDGRNLPAPHASAAFRSALRKLYNDIKARHGEDAVINLFPALPVSLAVETGRVWMPKADLPLRIYDQTRRAGFVETFTVGETD